MASNLETISKLIRTVSRVFRNGYVLHLCKGDSSLCLAHSTAHSIEWHNTGQALRLTYYILFLALRLRQSVILHPAAVAINCLWLYRTASPLRAGWPFVFC